MEVLRDGAEHLSFQHRHTRKDRGRVFEDTDRENIMKLMLDGLYLTIATAKLLINKG